MQAYLIHDGNSFYWSNDFGWCDIDSADAFSGREITTLDLPNGGEWITVDMAWRGEIDRLMKIARDIKKEFSYSKCSGLWAWHDREEPPTPSGETFSDFLSCLRDAVGPYIEADTE